MNWIKKLYLTCKIRFGTLAEEELQQLLAVYVTFFEPQEESRWITLGIWKKLTKSESKRFVRLYMKHHTADEGLLKLDWTLKHRQIRDVYLHCLASRNIPLTDAEEKWILNCGEPGAMRCLRDPLSEQGEIALLNSRNMQMMKNYVVCHLLRDKGETLLAKLASDNSYPESAGEYRKVLKKYFEAHTQFKKQQIYTSFPAQLALFADERNEELIMKVIANCDMENRRFENALIRRMAWGMSPKYLTWYLAYSYIADKELAAELLQKGVPEHIQDMLTISAQRRVIHNQILRSWLLLDDDWREEERKVYSRFLREDATKKRVADLKEFLQPRFAKGIVSPAMSAWAAAQCPELAKEAQLNLTRFENRLLEKEALINPLFVRQNSNDFLY